LMQDAFLHALERWDRIDDPTGYRCVSSSCCWAALAARHTRGIGRRLSGQLGCRKGLWGRRLSRPRDERSHTGNSGARLEA
jgi:hypothetical protein